MMPPQKWKTFSIRTDLLKALRKIADAEGKTRSELIHEVLWSYAKLKGEV